VARQFARAKGRDRPTKRGPEPRREHEDFARAEFVGRPTADEAEHAVADKEAAEEQTDLRVVDVQVRLDDRRDHARIKSCKPVQPRCGKIARKGLALYLRRLKRRRRLVA
jgi:hypothetical protein